MNLRKIITIIAVASLFFWAPSVIPVRAGVAIGPCGIQPVWVTGDTAFAFVNPVPCPTTGHGPTWVPFAIMGYAGSIIFAAIVANARYHCQLTAAEAWSGGILFWFSPHKMCK